MDLKNRVSELEDQTRADQVLIGNLRERNMQLEAEIQEYKEIAEQTCNVSCVCVCVCVCACVRAWHVCVRACVCVCVTRKSP